MRLSRNRHGAVLAVATLALTGAIGVTTATTAAPASAAENSIRVITHNVAKKPSALGGAIRKANATQGPEFVLLQEVCSSMVKRLQDDLGFTSYRPRRAAAKCGTDETVGEATVWTGPGAASVPAVNFPVDLQDGHVYGLACLDVTRNGRSIRACSTHLVAAKAPQSQRNQLTTAMKTELSPVVTQKDVVIVGGDFNTLPKTYPMDNLYGVGNDHKGQFRELHQMAGDGTKNRGGKATIGGGDDARKYDYIFASIKGSRDSGGTEQTCWKDGNPRTTDCTTSNHRILWGQVPLKPVG